RELPPVRAAGTPDRGGVGAARGRGHLCRAQTRCAPSRGTARTGAHGAARLHVPRAERLAVRRLLGPTGVSRAVGDRARKAGEPGAGSWEQGARKLACGTVSSHGRQAGVIRVVFARRTAGTAPRSPLPVPHAAVVVGPLVHGW